MLLLVEQGEIHLAEQVGTQERLGDKIGCPQLEGFEEGGRIGLAGHHDHRYPAGFLLSAQLAQRLQPVHHRHDHIEKDQIRQQGCRQLQRLSAVSGHHQFVGLTVQKGAEGLPHHRIIIGDQHPERFFVA